MIEEKDVYTLQELFDGYPGKVTYIARMSELSEETVYRMKYDRRGKFRLSTVVKVLCTFSKIYGRDFTLRNVDLGTTTIYSPRQNYLGKGVDYSIGNSV